MLHHSYDRCTSFIFLDFDMVLKRKKATEPCPTLLCYTSNLQVRIRPWCNMAAPLTHVLLDTVSSSHEPWSTDHFSSFGMIFTFSWKKLYFREKISSDGQRDLKIDQQNMLFAMFLIKVFLFFGKNNFCENNYITLCNVIRDVLDL